MGTILFPIGECDFKDKIKGIRAYTAYALNRASQMIKIRNLPDTMPERMVKLWLMTDGEIFVTDKYDGRLFAYFGTEGGEQDEYYCPKDFIITNPWQKTADGGNFEGTFRIGVDGILIRNDSTKTGLIPMINRYATALTEADLSMFICDINGRIQSIIAAADDRTKDSAERFIAGVRNGNLGIVSDNAFIESLKTVPYNSNGAAVHQKENIEYRQYLFAGLQNFIGLRTNYNMKREALNSAETTLDDSSLIPLCDDMMFNWREGFNEVNDKYGTNITCEWGVAWEELREEGEVNAESESVSENANE